jgi:predicted nucleic acid-binding protein
VILADTSAWIEYLRRTDTSVCQRMTELVEHPVTVATTQIVIMEVLSGARGEDDVRVLRDLLLRCELAPVDAMEDYERAAMLYRICRGNGATIRSMIDCLVAAVAIRTGARVLHADRDYDVLARHTALRLETV